MRYVITIIAMIFGFVMDTAAQGNTTDSVFVRNSRPIEFIVNKININDQDRRWITDSLIPALKALGDRGIVIGRATASPEGPTPNNERLANGRRASVDALLSGYGINTDQIRYDVIAEDFPLLRTLMWLEHDEEYKTVATLMKLYHDNNHKLKEVMKRYNGGKLWRRLLHQYFHKLRAVRIMAMDKAIIGLEQQEHTKYNIPTVSFIPQNLNSQAIQIPEEYIASLDNSRRELLSVKTNLLFDFAYMPGYDRFCPIPNVAIEYYPLHGHFTYGASFDGPWWQHYDEHKYFQLRNYQLHTRYYLRSGDISLRKTGKGAAFKGLFFSAYANANLYNICFDEHRGWEGEGWGAGLGIGYVLPLGGKEHWRLEFGLQAGYYQTDYDPYQWKCPVNPDRDPLQYYYKWYGDAKDFKKRQHRYTWFGPTRVDITLSYDLLYRKVKK